MLRSARLSTKRRRISSVTATGQLDLAQKMKQSKIAFGCLEATNETATKSTGLTPDLCRKRSLRNSSRRFAASSLNKTKQPPASLRTATGSDKYSLFTRNRSSGFLRGAKCTNTLFTRPVPLAAVHIVCAIGENRAHETCIASLDAGTPIALQVTKQGNGQTYAETIAYLKMLQPHEVILNEGRNHSPLTRKITQFYASRNGQDERKAAIKFIPRSYFDQTKGAALLRRLARTDTYDPTLLEDYIILSSTHALLYYIQHALGATISSKCLDVNVNSGGKTRMAIDRATLLQLEIMTNAKTGKGGDSLVATIDCTRTTVGARLLRTTLMSPPCRCDTINARLNLVDVFLQDEDFFYSISDHLTNLPAVDKMLTHVAMAPRCKIRKGMLCKEDAAGPSVSPRVASRGIAALVCIKATLWAIPTLVRSLEEHLSSIQTQEELQADGATAVTGKSTLLLALGRGPRSTSPLQKNHLLKAIIQVLSQPQLAEILDNISMAFTEGTDYIRNARAMQHQECFALKSGDDGLMDVLRKAFLANVDDIYRKADEYAEVHGLEVNIRYTASRGYYLSIRCDDVVSLPREFRHRKKNGKQVHCTTDEIQSLNSRVQDNVNDLLFMTHDKIQDILEDIRSKYDALAALSDSIALLDICLGFADKVTLSKQTWCRPTVFDTEEEIGKETNHSEGLIIRNGRFGIDIISDSNNHSEDSEEPQNQIPNDTVASKDQFFTVITGIGGSGKSTYLKQIAIIVILAHCGSYVPADQAKIPLRDRLCARIGTADDPENNISSFMLEMKEIAFICQNSSGQSLVLIDEVGRATSNEDGVAIAWSVSEFLLKKGVMTFFVTHYPEVCQLNRIYPTVQNKHLSASVSPDGSGVIRYSHKLVDGPCNASPDYGVEMAISCGWSIDVVHEARKMRSNLSKQLGDHNICLNAEGTEPAVHATRNIVLNKITKEIVQTVQNADEIASLRKGLQNLLVSVFRRPELQQKEVVEFLSDALEIDKTKDMELWHDSMNLSSNRTDGKASESGTSTAMSSPKRVASKKSSEKLNNGSWKNEDNDSWEPSKNSGASTSNSSSVFSNSSRTSSPKSVPEAKSSEKLESQGSITSRSSFMTSSTKMVAGKPRASLAPSDYVSIEHSQSRLTLGSVISSLSE